MTPSPSELPREKSSTPIRGEKQAKVNVSGVPPAPCFVPLTNPVGYGAESTYQCVTQVTQPQIQKPGHSMVGCTCGFYAWKPGVEQLGPGPPVLDVELYGTVIEHEHGYRGEHQRVLGVRFPTWCTACSAAPSTALWVDTFGYVGAFCTRCARGSMLREVTPGFVANALGVDVGYHPPKIPINLRFWVVVHTVLALTLILLRSFEVISLAAYLVSLGCALAIFEMLCLTYRRQRDRAMKG